MEKVCIQILEGYGHYSRGELEQLFAIAELVKKANYFSPNLFTNFSKSCVAASIE